MVYSEELSLPEVHYRMAGYLWGLTTGMWVPVTESHLLLVAITQRVKLLGGPASLLSGLVFLEAPMLVKRGQAKTGGGDHQIG